MTLDRLTEYAKLHTDLANSSQSRTQALCLYVGVIQSMSVEKSIENFDATRALVTKHVRSVFLPLAGKLAHNDVMAAADAIYMGTAAYSSLVSYATQQKQAYLQDAGGTLTKTFRVQSPEQIGYRHWDNQCKKFEIPSGHIAQVLFKFADNPKLAHIIRYNALAKLSQLGEAAEMSGYPINKEAYQSGVLSIFNAIGLDKSEFLPHEQVSRFWTIGEPGLVK